MSLLSQNALNDLVDTVSRYKAALARAGGQVVSAANDPNLRYPEGPINPIPVAVDAAGHAHFAMPNIARTPINALNEIAHGVKFWEPQYATDDSGRVVTSYPKGGDVGTLAMMLAGGANSPRGLPVEGEPLLYGGPNTTPGLRLVEKPQTQYQPFAGDNRLGPTPQAPWVPPHDYDAPSNVVDFPGKQQPVSATSGGGQRQWTEVQPGFEGLSDEAAASKLQSTDPRTPGYDTLFFSPKSGLNRQGEWAGTYDGDNLPSVVSSLDHGYPERTAPTGYDLPQGFKNPVNLREDYRPPGKPANDNATSGEKSAADVETQMRPGSMWSWQINTRDFASHGKGPNAPSEGRDLHFLAIPTGKFDHAAQDNVQVRLFDAKNGVEFPSGTNGNWVPHSELKPYAYNGVGTTRGASDLNDNPPSQWTGFSPTHFYTAEADDELNPTMVQHTGNKTVPSLGLTEVRLPDGNGSTRLVPTDHLWELPTYDTPPSGTSPYKPGNWEPEPPTPANDR